MRSSKTTDQGSTGNGRDLQPYWTPSCEEKSTELLSRTETGCAGSDSSCSRELQPQTLAKSWFSTKHAFHQKKSLFRTSSASSTFSVADYTDSENTLLRCRKIRIYLDAENRRKARRYFGLSRYWYNKAVEHIRDIARIPRPSALLRQLQEQEQNGWAFDCPQRIRLHAVIEAVNAAITARKVSRRTGKPHRLSFRSRKDTKQRFGFDKISLESSHVFSKRNHRLEFAASESVPEPSAEGTRIIRESGRFYLIVPVRVPCREIREPRQSVVALDLGIRTFLTYYSDETHGSIGKGDFAQIVRLLLCLDDLLSRIAKASAKRRQRMKKAAARLRWRIRDLIDELHRKSAVFLATRFETILLPTFETSRMTSKASRRIRSKTVRSMLTFAFYRFRQCLESVAERYGARVLLVDESYTSKTCSYCGHVQEIGGRKRFRCKNCQVDVDRDFNGARGIYLSCVAGSRLVSNVDTCIVSNR